MHADTDFAYFRYFAHFAYMDVSWAHSVLQLGAEKTLGKLSVLILGKCFGRYYIFLVISDGILQQCQVFAGVER